MKRFFPVVAAAVQLAMVGRAADASRLLPFQARLADSAGKAVPDGSTVVQFQLFGEATGGSSLWAGELHRVTVNGGLVNVVLGTKNPLPLNYPGDDSRPLFGSTLYLQATPDANGDGKITQLDPPLLPRQTVLPVLFASEAAEARNATKLAGRDWSAVLGAGMNDPASPQARIRSSLFESNAVTSVHILDKTIVSADLAPSAVETTNLANGSVTAEKLGPDTATKFAQSVGRDRFEMSATTKAWTSASDMELNLNISSPNVFVTMSGSGRGIGGSGPGTIVARLNRDDGTEIIPLGGFLVNLDGYRAAYSFQFIVAGLTSGPHKFRLEFKPFGSGIVIDPVASPETDARRMQVFEFR